MAINHPVLERKYVLFLIALTGCVALTVIFDLVESSLNRHSSFYFTESFLFSSIWWLFVPFIFWQFRFARTGSNKLSNVILALLPAIFHLFTYPALVWLISAIFYEVTFPYWQTFEYGVLRYGILVLIAYPMTLAFFRFAGRRSTAEQIHPEHQQPRNTNEPATSMVVTDGNQKTVLETKDILFFSASPPYIFVHHKTKRYLHNETLKSVSTKLDNDVFVRIHKSTIVNISQVRSFKSRLNGDYDVFVSDGTELRLSRNYAADFKDKIQRSHRDTTE